ncbi:MAG: hypothetical protein K2L10_03595 [Ruminococcus sp.]|nr:hypothetical protein [Ruminococcus sp.]
MKDNSGNILDVYEIDEETGVGADSENDEVNLLQTGNNSFKNIIIAFGVSMMTVFGLISVKFSRIIRRKND